MRNALLFLVMLASGCTCPNPGDGEKVGTIVKLSHEGLFCKTGEAQLIRGGMANGSGAFGVTPFDFTVSDALWPIAESAFVNQTEIRIRYHSAWSPWCASETGHFLVGIAPENLGK